MGKTPLERSSILVILSEPHRVSGGTSGGGERRTPVTSTRAWLDRHTRVVTDILCFRATSQGSFARPVTRVYASARWAALRMTNERNSRPRRCAGPFDHAFVANLMPLRESGDDDIISTGRRRVVRQASPVGRISWSRWTADGGPRIALGPSTPSTSSGAGSGPSAIRGPPVPALRRTMTRRRTLCAPHRR